MKFAKQIETAAFELPEEWRPHLIHYKLLKKAIRLVVDELQSRGLSTDMLSSSLEHVQISYVFDGDANDPQPCVKITIGDPAAIKGTDLVRNLHVEAAQPDLIKIKLIKDSEFFHLLLDNLSNAATFHESEQQRFSGHVHHLETQLATAASPHKKDMYIWREVFKLYIESNVFGDAKECTLQSYRTSKERLAWFTQELTRTNLAKKMSKASKEALKQFIEVNAKLVDIQQFHALNLMAITKILKKHDKRSGLRARAEFLSFAKTNTVAVDHVVLLSLCSMIAAKLVSIVPQVDHHACPICYAIAWRPIRLECGHVFCVRCLIKAHRKKLYDCPLCRRHHAVLNADARNLDRSLQNFLLLYFPKEIKEKRRDNEREQAMMDMEALTGRAWTTTAQKFQNDSCCIM